jgi:hypothetical protein
MPFSQEMAKYKEKRILLFDLRIFTAIQIYLKYVKVPKSLDPNGGVWVLIAFFKKKYKVLQKKI